MMKMTKKLFAVLLSLLMVFGMAAAVSAEETVTGTITVENPTANTESNEIEYNAYQIFAVTYNEEKTSYAYTISTDSPWLAAFAAVAEGSAVHTSTFCGLTLIPVENDAAIYNVTTDSNFNAAQFAALLNDALPTLTDVIAIPLEKTGDAMVAEKLALGYYFVTSKAGSLCNLTTTDPDAVIYDKNDMSFDKSDDNKKDVEIGEIVEYTITTKVPNTTGYSSYKFEISDTMSEGLTYDHSSIQIMVNGTALATDCYTLTENENGFTLSIDVKEIQISVSQPITITYNARVNENALRIEDNTATLIYTNDPVTLEEASVTRNEYVYTMKLNVVKVELNNSEVKLSGAKFVLRNPNGEYYHYATKAAEGDNPAVEADVEWVDIGIKTIEEAVAEGLIDEVTTDENGEAGFNGLKNGTYYLIETEAPKGYNKLKEPVEVIISVLNEPNPDSGTTRIEGETEVNANADQTESRLLASVGYTEISYVKSEVIGNATGSVLPETGGIGTTIFYVLGGGLMLAATVLLVVKKRMSAE